jgi:hypothetical protein
MENLQTHAKVSLSNFGSFSGALTPCNKPQGHVSKIKTRYKETIKGNISLMQAKAESNTFRLKRK